MTLEAIRLRGFAEPDRDAVEKAVVARVMADPEPFLKAYLQNPASFGGRYICADLFKETFSEFNASPEARNRFNGPVHNAAAVLSAEAFRRSIADDSDPQRNEAIFLTGIPGAGKTSTVLSTGRLLDEWRTLFEGQLSKPETAFSKIQQAIDAELKVTIVVVHPHPEVALENTFKRFAEYGRGASISIMSEIQGDLPKGLSAIRSQFGDDINLIIRDVRDRNNPVTLNGWRNADVLASEGSREAIKSRLEAYLEKQWATGRITADCYRQAGGRLAQHEGMAGNGGRGNASHGERRELPPGDRKADILKTGTDFWRTTAAAGQTSSETNKPRQNESHKPGPKSRP